MPEANIGVYAELRRYLDFRRFPYPPWDVLSQKIYYAYCTRIRPICQQAPLASRWISFVLCMAFYAKGRSQWLRPSGCRKSGLRHFFEVYIAPLRLRRGQGAMQGNPCYARLFADLTRMSPNPIKASGGQSRAPPVAGGARRKPSEQGSARKAPRADAARPLRTALRPPTPRGFFDKLRGAANGCAPEKMRLSVIPPCWPARRSPG